MKKRNLAFILATLASVIALVRSLNKALAFELENRSGRVLDVTIGTESNPDAILVRDLKVGEKRPIDLTILPLVGHDAVYIRFPGDLEREPYLRTLIYDIDEHKGPFKAAIVDYGQGLLDIRSVIK